MLGKALRRRKPPGSLTASCSRDVNVTAAVGGSACNPPHLRDPGQGGPATAGFHAGRYRNEEDKFRPDSRATTAELASSSRGAMPSSATGIDGGASADTAPTRHGPRRRHVQHRAALTVEVTIVSFDPQMHRDGRQQMLPRPPTNTTCQPTCSDMNQVTRRGSNFHNLAVDVSDSDRRVEFYDGNHARAWRCAASAALARRRHLGDACQHLSQPMPARSRRRIVAATGPARHCSCGSTDTGRQSPPVRRHSHARAYVLGRDRPRPKVR